MGLAIGIDLGSTFSVISFVKNDVPEVIPNAEGNRITPSVFSLDEDNNVLIGDLAVDYESQVPDRTIRLVKRKWLRGSKICILLVDGQNIHHTECLQKS